MTLMKKLIDVDALASANVLECTILGNPEGDSVYVEWHPGNGTRYPVMFTRMSPDVARLNGGGEDNEGVVLVSLLWPDGKGRAHAFSGFAHESYVQEKLNPSYGGDVLALTALINLALNPTEAGVRYAKECLDRACHRAA
jgi:hypothetical protein